MLTENSRVVLSLEIKKKLNLKLFVLEEICQNLSKWLASRIVDKHFLVRCSFWICIIFIIQGCLLLLFSWGWGLGWGLFVHFMCCCLENRVFVVFCVCVCVRVRVCMLACVHTCMCACVTGTVKHTKMKYFPVPVMYWFYRSPWLQSIFSSAYGAWLLEQRECHSISHICLHCC